MAMHGGLAGVPEAMYLRPEETNVASAALEVRVAQV